MDIKAVNAPYGVKNKSKKITQSEYKVGQRFVFQSIRNLDFSDISCILELIDNSVDADSKNIDIIWEKDTKKTNSYTTNTYTLAVTDDGTGVPKDRMMEVFTKLGNDEDYLSDRVGHYGVGVKAALINLMEEGVAQIRSTHNNQTRQLLKIEHSDSLMNATLEDDTLYGLFTDENNVVGIEDSNGKGTQIVVPNIKTNLTETQIIKTCSVVYYPNKRRFKDFKLTVNGKEVRFIDPMYRNLKDKSSKHMKYDSVTKQFKFNDKDIDVKTLSFYPKFDKDKHCSSWDMSKNKASLKPSNSGIYLRLGGRYISTGQQLFPGVTYQNVLQNLRIEIELPKSLIELFGVQVNKSKLGFDLSNPDMANFYQVIREICSEHIRVYNSKPGKKISVDETKALEKAVQKINKYLTDSGREKPIVGQVGTVDNGGLIEKRKSPTNKTGTVEPTGKGPKRTPKDPRTQIGKGKGRTRMLPNVDFELQSQGDLPMYDWGYDNGMLVITLNRDTKWVELLTKEDDMFTSLFKVYSSIHEGLKKANESVDGEQMVKDMRDLVARETLFLNKVLSDK